MTFLGEEYESVLEQLGRCRRRQEDLESGALMARYKGFGPDGRTAEELEEAREALEEQIGYLEQRLDELAG